MRLSDDNKNNSIMRSGLTLCMKKIKHFLRTPLKKDCVMNLYIQYHMCSIELHLGMVFRKKAKEILCLKFSKIFVSFQENYGSLRVFRFYFTLVE